MMKKMVIAFMVVLSLNATLHQVLCGHVQTDDPVPRLGNGVISVEIDPSGRLLKVEDKRNGRIFAVREDSFRITTDKGVFSNASGFAAREVMQSGETIAYSYLFEGTIRVVQEYRLRPGAAYFERTLTVTAPGDGALTLYNIQPGLTVYSDAPAELLTYDTFWNAPTAAFLRWDEAGIFCGVENPFFKTTMEGAALAMAYSPSMILSPGEVYTGDPQFMGVYSRTGRMIADHTPLTVLGNRPRYVNPDGHKPLDLAEIRAMQRFAADYMDVSLDSFRFINYHFFFPLPQMPEAGSAAEKKLLNVVDMFDRLGGDLFMFNPMYPYDRPEGKDDAFWELGPDGSAAGKIMDRSREMGIGFGYYMGCARHGKDGNASALPFAPEKTEWKKRDAAGRYYDPEIKDSEAGGQQHPVGENCMACDEFAEWWLRVQENTIEKYGLKLWSWDPGPGNGKFCYDPDHGHLPGQGAYKGWRNATELMRKLKERHPEVFLQAFYGRKEYGMWGLKYFDQHESYWELTVPYGSTIHPDLHADRVNADGIRMQNWWNQTFRFLPPQINHVLAHRIQEGFWDDRLPEAWDHNGWRYSVMSALACGGSIMTVILPENIATVRGMKEFYAKWLAWGRNNFELARYNVPFGEQLRPGGIDGWARINEGRGFIFLCNQNPRPAKISFTLDEEIGLDTKGNFVLREHYPSEGPLFFDEAHPDGVFASGDSLECIVPAYQVVLMELSPSSSGKEQPAVKKEWIDKAVAAKKSLPVRELDQWQTDQGKRWEFPFHGRVGNIRIQTDFHADGKIRKLLKANVPANLARYESLTPEWKKEYPDNFAWARPDRLWLVIPFCDASKVRDPGLAVNGRQVEVEAHKIGACPIIYYADITDYVEWDAKNSLELSFAGLEANQFMGPYLDYPGNDAPFSDKICSLTGSLYEGSVVYQRPIDPPMPVRTDPYAESALPIVKSADMSPGFFKTGQEVTVTARLNLPPEEIASVWISFPGMDAQMYYDADEKAWQARTTPGWRPGIIMDIDFFRVWAVTKSGYVSKPVDLPIEWKF